MWKYFTAGFAIGFIGVVSYRLKKHMDDTPLIIVSRIEKAE